MRNLWCPIENCFTNFMKSGSVLQSNGSGLLIMICSLLIQALKINLLSM